MYEVIFKTLKIATICAALPGLSACSETFYYREGGSMTAAENAKAKCEADALEKAPVAMMKIVEKKCAWKEVCDKDGKCDYENVCELETENKDVNEDLRNRLIEFCVEDRGYKLVDLPTCPHNVREAVVPSRTTVMPRLTKDTCYIRHDDGSIQIVNPVYTSARSSP